MSKRKRIYPERSYIILGYDKQTKLYHGYLRDRCTGQEVLSPVSTTFFSAISYAYRWNVHNYFEPDSLKNWCSWKSNSEKYNTDSVNQLMYYFARELVLNLNRRNFRNLEWHVYRANSKDCPVHTDFLVYNMMKRRKIAYNANNVDSVDFIQTSIN